MSTTNDTRWATRYNRTRKRRYPRACLSAYCGKIRSECGDCPNLPALKEFEAWRKRTKAYQPDPIWAPTLYYAGISEEETT